MGGWAGGDTVTMYCVACNYVCASYFLGAHAVPVSASRRAALCFREVGARRAHGPALCLPPPCTPALAPLLAPPSLLSVHTALGSLEIEDLLVGQRCPKNRFLASSRMGEYMGGEVVEWLVGGMHPAGSTRTSVSHAALRSSTRGANGGAHPNPQPACPQARSQSERTCFSMPKKGWHQWAARRRQAARRAAA